MFSNRIMEIIGKGEYELGAVWVARKIPKGHVTAHANQARITTFPLNDPENCLYSPDVVTFAKKHGWYAESAPDAEFSFSDTYNPVTFEGARFCDARVSCCCCFLSFVLKILFVCKHVATRYGASSEISWGRSGPTSTWTTPRATTSPTACPSGCSPPTRSA